MDSNDKNSKYRQKKYIPVAIIILLLLLAVFTFYYIQNNADVNAMLDCKCANPSPIATGYEPTEPVKSSPPDAIHVTPGGNGSGGGGNIPAVTTIAGVELFDYNQDGANTLRVVLKMNSPSLSISDLSVNYENVNDETDNGTIAIDIITNMDSNYSVPGTYLVSIPAAGAGNPLSAVGNPETYEYYFTVNTDAGISKSVNYPFQSGTGADAANAFEIQNIVQFDALRYYTETNGSGKYFEVTKDINFPEDWNNASHADYATYGRAKTDGNGWVSIGGNKTASPITAGGDVDRFQGNLNGNNKTFSNFTIRSSAYSAGLFGSIGGTGVAQKSEIKNIKIEKMTVQTSAATKPSVTGSLAGYANNTTVLNVSSSYSTIEGGTRVGGLIGQINNVTVNNSSVNGPVRSTQDNTGGLIGAGTNSLINNSVSVSEINAGKAGSSDSTAGGIIGLTNMVNINNSVHTGNITGYDYVGGIVGYWQGANIFIENSEHTGDINARQVIGGIVGLATTGETFKIKSSNATGNISVGAASGQDGSGGIVGKINKNNTLIEDCHYVGTINGTSNKTNVYQGIGGIVGYSVNKNGTIINSSANVEINVLKGSGIGGIIGHTVFEDWNVINSTSCGNITSEDIGTDISDLVSAGGLVGTMRNNTWIVNSSSSININGKTVGDVSDYGGLVGTSAAGGIVNSYATGNIVGNKARVGGLAGVTSMIQIDNCYATGNVAGGTQVGGLVGNLAPSIIKDDPIDLNLITGYIPSYLNNSYATGNITGTHTVGGLVGETSASVIQNSVALNGEVNGIDAGRIYCSKTLYQPNNDITLINNYAYGAMTTTASSGFNYKTLDRKDGADLPSASDAKTLTFYEGTLDWNDGTTVWEIRSGYPLPVLTWQTTVPANPPAWAIA
ncbi:hypothetical protein MsAg5_05290 [Methanosarcinaceae archaeon Ag5]|uniref:GLUG domain-containing protein n=1 Tax=Methanolapillus africanus TaxID=3028297 RepID=A0AAE4SDE5_9EURY|nr:hypothetical protein [Methanosarcinaceae archaeon Ag5]